MRAANPDFTVTLPDGSRGYMPGCIARLYEQLLDEHDGSNRGSVTYFGKPHAPAFEAALRLLGDNVEPSRVLHVGDSLQHDVAGANAAGIHSLFVAGGIHADELGIMDAGACADEPVADGEAPQLSQEALERVFREQGVTPTMTVERFIW